MIIKGYEEKLDDSFISIHQVFDDNCHLNNEFELLCFLGTGTALLLYFVDLRNHQSCNDNNRHRYKGRERVARHDGNNEYNQGADTQAQMVGMSRPGTLADFIKSYKQGIEKGEYQWQG